MPSMSRGVINFAKQFLSHPFSRIKSLDQWAADRDPVLTSITAAKIGKTAIHQKARANERRATRASLQYFSASLLRALPQLPPPAIPAAPITGRLTFSIARGSCPLRAPHPAPSPLPRPAAGCTWPAARTGTAHPSCFAACRGRRRGRQRRGPPFPVAVADHHPPACLAAHIDRLDGLAAALSSRLLAAFFLIVVLMRSGLVTGRSAPYV